MVVAILFALLAVGAGLAVLRVLGLSDGATAIGLAPVAGLALLAIVCTWAATLHAPPVVAGSLVVLIAVAGFGAAVGKHGPIRGAWARCRRVSGLLLACGLVV